MGVLHVSGTAKQDFPAERFQLTITLRASAAASGEALTLGKAQTETFLLMMQKLGIAPELFRAEAEHVGQVFNKGFEFCKTMSLSLEADLRELERLTCALSDLSNVEYQVTPELRDRFERENAVLRQAVQDSRQRAETLAQMLGTQVTGVQELTDGCAEPPVMLRTAAACHAEERFDPLAGKLALPVITIRRDVNIAWAIQ